MRFQNKFLERHLISVNGLRQSVEGIYGTWHFKYILGFSIKYQRATTGFQEVFTLRIT